MLSCFEKHSDSPLKAGPLSKVYDTTLLFSQTYTRVHTGVHTQAYTREHTGLY